MTDSYQQRQTRVTTRILSVLGIGVFVGIFAFVFQSMDHVDQGYRTRDLEDRMTELRSDNHTLRLRITVASSIENLSKAKEALNLKEIEDIRYVQAGGSQVSLAPFLNN